jgi:hypothetical protein
MTPAWKGVRESGQGELGVGASVTRNRRLGALDPVLDGEAGRSAASRYERRRVQDRSPTRLLVSKTPDAQHRCALRAHVHTRRATPLRPSCARAHPPRNTVAPFVHTCTPAAQHRCALRAHVHTRRATPLHPRCTRAHPPRNTVAPFVHTCTPDAQHRYTLGAHVHTRRVRELGSELRSAETGKNWGVGASVTRNREIGCTRSCSPTRRRSGSAASRCEPRRVRDPSPTRLLVSKMRPFMNSRGHS